MEHRSRTTRTASLLISALLVAALAAAGYYIWQQRAVLRLPKSMPVQQSAAPLDAAPAPAEVASAPPSGPAIQYPIEAIAKPASNASGALPADAANTESYFSKAIGELVGRPAMLSFLQVDGFARRVVATVDNLARPHAAVMLWPVLPAPGRFSTAAAAGAPLTSIAPANAARYTPFVKFVESIDTAKAVALYARSYPLFQTAYEELGYPKRYFNDRLVAVIDHLLATPVATSAPAVKLTQIKGPMTTAQPWLHYEFVDAQLESGSAGQKMLLRMGPDNQTRLKTKLREVRQQITGAPLAASVDKGAAGGPVRP
jgi:hypothetical protein